MQPKTGMLMMFHFWAVLFSSTELFAPLSHNTGSSKCSCGGTVICFSASLLQLMFMCHTINI